MGMCSELNIIIQTTGNYVHYAKKNRSTQVYMK